MFIRNHVINTYQYSVNVLIKPVTVTYCQIETYLKHKASFYINSGNIFIQGIMQSNIQFLELLLAIYCLLLANLCNRTPS